MMMLFRYFFTLLFFFIISFFIENSYYVVLAKDPKQRREKREPFKISCEGSSGEFCENIGDLKISINPGSWNCHIKKITPNKDEVGEINSTGINSCNVVLACSNDFKFKSNFSDGIMLLNYRCTNNKLCRNFCGKKDNECFSSEQEKVDMKFLACDSRNNDSSILDDYRDGSRERRNDDTRTRIKTVK